MKKLQLTCVVQLWHGIHTHRGFHNQGLHGHSLHIPHTLLMDRLHIGRKPEQQGQPDES